MRASLKYVSAGALVLVLGTCRAQADPAPASVSTAPVAAIPLSEVTAQAESVSLNLQDMDRQLESDSTLNQIGSELPAFTREMNSNFEETSKIISSRPSLDTLRSLQANWQRLEQDLKVWDRELKRRAAEIDQETAGLEQTRAAWSMTLSQAQSASAPADLIQGIHGVLTSIGLTRDRIELGHSKILSFQNRVGEGQARAERMMSSLQRVQNEALDHLFVRDSPVLWKAPTRSRSGETLLEQGQGSLSTQLKGLRAYIERRGEKFFVHLLVFLILLGIFHWARNRVDALALKEVELHDAARIFDAPVAAACLASLFLAAWIYPQAPRLLWIVFGAMALIPAVLILRRLLDRDWYPVLNSLIIFYFVDRLSVLAAALPLLSRALFFMEMLGGVLFLSYRLLRARRTEGHLSRAIKTGMQIALGIFIVSWIAVALGYVNLGNLLGHALLGSAYFTVILYGLVRILEFLLMLAMSIVPLAGLAMVGRYRTLFYRRGRLVLEVSACALWALHTLWLLALRQPFFDTMNAALTFEISLGSLQFTLGHLVAFGLTLWAAFLVSRFIRFVLEEDVYSRLSLRQGMPYAVSTILHYLILLGGFLMAIAALGFDMTKFTILAGAFGVGVGFGTQNIINNFVSGLILLFEQPVKVGDMIQIADATGVVQKIGIRATVIRTNTDSDIIVPNANLISNDVTNWTLTDRQRSLDIPISVARGVDPKHVITLLQEIASAHPQVAKDPAPKAIFVKLSGDSLDFSLRAWTTHIEDLSQVRSDLTLSLSSVFARENIAVR